jgi:hypothetical protein
MTEMIPPQRVRSAAGLTTVEAAAEFERAIAAADYVQASRSGEIDDDPENARLAPSDPGAGVS